MVFANVRAGTRVHGWFDFGGTTRHLRRLRVIDGLVLGYWVGARHPLRHSFTPTRVLHGFVGACALLSVSPESMPAPQYKGVLEYLSRYGIR